MTHPEPVRVTREAREDEPALVCESARIRLSLLPELGARVVELRDRASGRQWLAAPPGWRQRRAPFGAPAEDYIEGGWDECFPSVAGGLHPGPAYHGTELADHGELWSRAWSCRAIPGGVATAIEGVRFPYRFERRLTLLGDAVVAEYELDNRGAEPLACLWSMHAVFAPAPGLRIDLPGVERMTVDWASEPITRDLSRLHGVEAPFAAKLFTPRLAEGVAALHDPATGERLTLRFDTDVAPYLGVWINEGVLPPHRPLHHVALEPSTSDADALADAAARGTQLTLAPHGRARWQVRIELDAGHGHPATRSSSVARAPRA